MEIPVKCACGSVQGIASNVSSNTGTRVVCYCDDCQSFAKHLGREDIVDEYGGTDIFQMAVCQLKITQGIEQVHCLRLTPKGLYRWYTECCKTPIGNTMASKVPFVGIIHNFMDDEGVRDKNLGPVRGYVHSKFARKAVPASLKTSGFPIGLLLRIFGKMFIWKIKGMHKPSPFFDSEGNPVSTPSLLNDKE